MPDGLTHYRQSKRALIPITLIAGVLSYTYSPTAGLGFLCGSIVGTVVTPDIDSPAQSYEETRMIRWNRPVGKLYSAFWESYQVLHKHRGLSHWPIIGTAGRFFYLFIVLRLFLYLLGGFCYDLWDSSCASYLMETHPFSLLFIFPEFFIWTFIGQCVPDTIHIIADRRSTARKRRGRGRGRGWW